MSDENKTTPLGDGDADLNAELEDLTAKFSEEYEKAMNKGEDSGDSEEDEACECEHCAEGDHEYIYDDAEIPEDMLCVRCKKSARDLTVSEDNEFCEDCRKTLLKYPYPIKSFVSVFFTVISIFLALTAFVVLFIDSTKMAQAMKLEKQNKLLEAAMIYEPLASSLSDANSVSLKASAKVVELLYKMGNTDYIATYFEAFPAYALKLPMYSKVQKMNDRAALFLETIQENFQPISQYQEAPSESIPYDELMSTLDAKLPEYDGKENSDMLKGAIHYVRYYLAYLSKKGDATIISILEDVKKELPDDPWLYAYTLANSYSSAGDYQKSLSMCEEMKKYNANDPAPYVVEAVSYRLQKDYDKSLSACEEGMKTSETPTFEFNRQKSITLLLKGDYELAKEVMLTDYMSNLSPTVLDTLALSALKTNDTALYDEIAGIYVQYEADFGETLKAFKDGTITLEQIFLEGNKDVY